MVAPLVDPNYLGDERDRRRVCEALRAAIEIFSQPALAAYGVIPILPASHMDDDAALDHYIGGR